MATPSQNDLDELFARIDADPTCPSPGDIQSLVAYYRQQRAQRQAGPSRAKKEAGPKVEIDLSKLGLATPSAPAMKRRL